MNLLALVRFRTLVLALLLASSSAQADNHAVLVGVSNYPGLAPQLSLAGPANDVVLMRELLLKRNFSPKNVRVLADGVATATDPTRANIVAALGALAAQVRTGDFVYLHFSGHGSQQPSRPGKVPPEPDRLDEIFLPRDIGPWNGAVGSVANALSDTELNAAIGALRAKGAFVWAVFDSCHSGTMARGLAPDDIRYRQVSPEALNIPANGGGPVETAPRGGWPAEESALGAPVAGSAATAGFVAFYASQSVERTPEMRLPAGSPERQPRGLFSYVIAQTLESHPDLSYRQLGEQVLQRYAALGLNSPTPMFEGTALDAPVFGVRARPGLRQWPLRTIAGETEIAAGNLHQFNEGAVFALVPSPAAADHESLGYLRATRVMPLSARLKPVEFNGKPAPAAAALKDGLTARLVDPSLRLDLRVALLPGARSAAETAARELLVRLRAQPPEGLRLEWVEHGTDADVQLRLEDNKLWFLARDGQWAKEGPNRTHSVDVSRLTDVEAEKITDTLRRIAKASNLLRMAAYFGSRGAASPKGLEIEASVIRTDGKRVRFDTTALPQFRNGDKVEFQFKNKGRGMVDVTALYLDSEYGISAMYPEAGRINRLEAGASDAITLEMNDETTGTERLLVFAIDATAQASRADFSFLAQPRLERDRSAAELSSSLDGLLREAAFGTRAASLVKSPLGGADVKVFGWRVVKP